MPPLFGRVVEVEVGPAGAPGVRVDDGSVSFLVEKSTKKTSNKAVIKLYNLSDETRRGFEAPDLRVRLRAGYDGIAQLLFQGSIGKRGVLTTREADTLITTLECTDQIPPAAGSARTRFNWHFEGGVTSTTVLQTLLNSTGLPLDFIDPALPVQTYKYGVTFLGTVEDALDRLTRPVGALWSIQDGALQVTLRGGVTDDLAVLLTPQTGLIGTPTRTDKGIDARSLLIPQIHMGGTVRIESEFITGFYRVRNLKHEGDLRGDTWYTSIESKELRAR